MVFWLIVSVASAVDYAGDVFSLEIWKLTLPIDDDGDGITDEVMMPVLRNFEDPAFFHLSETRDSIVFRVPGAALGIGEPRFLRCGLRELVRKTDIPATWGSNDGRVHNLTISLAFNVLPKANTQVIAAGIYADDEPVISIRLEQENVLLTRDGLDPIVLSKDYTPGEWIDLVAVINRGRIRVLKDLKEIGEWGLEKSELHYRAGCEVQTDSGFSTEAPASGEVEIRKLYVTHKP